jgi:hypothetical protein
MALTKPEKKGCEGPVPQVRAPLLGANLGDYLIFRHFPSLLTSVT